MQSLQVTSNFYSFTLKTWISSFPFKYLRLTDFNLQLQAESKCTQFFYWSKPLTSAGGLAAARSDGLARLHEPWNMPRVTTIFPQRGGEKKRHFLESIASHYINYAKAPLNPQLGMPPLSHLSQFMHYQCIHLPGTRMAKRTYSITSRHFRKT